jgi:hypothetical protein
MNNCKCLAALVFSIPGAAALTESAYACPVSSAYRYVLLDSIPSEIPTGAIVLSVDSKKLEEESGFGETRHVSELSVNRVEAGDYGQSSVKLILAPFTSCTGGSESENSTILVGYVHVDEKNGTLFFPVQYIAKAHRRVEFGDLDRAFIPEKKYIDRALRALTDVPPK